VIVIAVSWTDGTVTVALPQIEPAQAFTVVVPAAVAYTAPELAESLVTVATLAFEEFQEAEASVSTLLSLNVPVAVKRCAVPSEIVALLGFTAMETSAGGVVVAGWYSSAALNALKLLSSPPARRTFPSFKSVAVWNLRDVTTFPIVENLSATGS
jgi:hypothetical protein